MLYDRMRDACIVNDKFLPIPADVIVKSRYL